jgi:hypothetical protein
MRVDEFKGENAFSVVSMEARMLLLFNKGSTSHASRTLGLTLKNKVLS